MRLLAHTLVTLSLALAVAAPNQLELHHVDPSGAEVAVASAKPDILSLDDATALIIVDVQTCFITAGLEGFNPDLPVAHGGDVVIGIAALAAKVTAAGGIVASSQDWHTPKHSSFKLHGGKWPVHCVQYKEADDAGKKTAALVSDLAKHVTPGWTFKKAFITGIESYSAFGGYDKVDDNTTEWTKESQGGNSLDDRLKGRKQGKVLKPITKLLVTGIASDYCVKATAEDGNDLGYDVYYVADLGRGVAAATTLDAMKELAGLKKRKDPAGKEKPDLVKARMHLVSTVSPLPTIAS